MEFIGTDKLVYFDSYHDLESDEAEGTEFDDKEYATMLEENDRVDENHKAFLLCLLTKNSKTKPLKKRREKDDDGVCELDSDCYSDEETKDPHYELFLKSLRAHEKSYVVKDERNGLHFVVKYEGGESSDKECDLDYKRKLRSATKENNGPSDKCKHGSQSTSSSKEAVNLSHRKLRNRASKSEKVENVKISTDEIVMDPDYRTFMKTFKFVDDHYVFEYGAHTVVYEPSDGERNHEREEDDDEWADDVKILDGTLFGKEGYLDPSMAVANDVLRNSEFRHELIAVLRKPYDKEEYDKMWFDIESRKPEERHIELRHGRERSHSTNKCGKSYLDYHPYLRRQLSRFHDDKPKCLNLLRGFFFWLKKASHNGSFQPWQDAECLAIYPESG